MIYALLTYTKLVKNNAAWITKMLLLYYLFRRVPKGSENARGTIHGNSVSRDYEFAEFCFYTIGRDIILMQRKTSNVP